VAVAGNYAYVADYWAGLRVIDVSNPASPQERGHCDTPDLAWGVAVVGNYVYVADERAGLRVIDVSNPQSPQERGYCDTPDLASGVAVAGDYAYVADGSAGLRIIEFYGAGVEETPNAGVRTANRGASIVRGSLSLPRMTNAQFPMTMLDISGRRVMDLHPGANDVRHLSPGIHFVRFGEHGFDRVAVCR
jgi:hypothetical protein